MASIRMIPTYSNSMIFLTKLQKLACVVISSFVFCVPIASAQGIALRLLEADGTPVPNSVMELLSDAELAPMPVAIH